MFWIGLAAGVLVPLGLVPLCATVLLRRWLANEGFEDPDDDDDDEFDWRAPSDPRGGQHATPAPVETPIEKAFRLSTPERPVGAIVPGPRLTDDPSRIDDSWIAEQRARMAAKQVAREQAAWDDAFAYAPSEDLAPGQIVALTDEHGEVSDRMFVVAACKGAITAVDPVDGGPRQFAKTGNVRRLGEQHASPVHGFGDCVPGLPRRTDAELDALVDTIRRNA